MQPLPAPVSCVADCDLELIVLLPLPTSVGIKKHVAPVPVYEVLGMGPRLFCMLGKPSTNWATSSGLMLLILLFLR